ncbi:MAG: NUDIX domain-containing protein, partial [Methylovirgula sp.]
SRGFGLLENITIRRRRFDAKPQEISREVYDVGDGAAILLYDPERGRVLLVRQFRLAAYLGTGRETIVECCAGKIDGIDPAARIIMEVQEETGYAVKDPRFIFEAFMSPGVLAEKLSFFIAPYSPADKIDAGGGVDDDEDIEVIEPSFDEALAMIDSGEIIDVKTILLLQYAKLIGLMGSTR